MKKVFLVLVLAVLLGVASPVASMDISVGAKAGIAHSQYMGEDHRNLIDVTGKKNALSIRPIFGAFAVFGIREQLLIQPELLLVSSGGKAVDEADPSDTYWVEKYYYISLPVLLKGIFAFMDGHFFVLGGPAIQIAPGDGAEAGTEFIGGVEQPKYPVDIAAFNLSLMVGGGYLMALFGGEVSFELRFTQSVSRSFDQDIFDDNHRTWSIALMGGYAYKLKE